MSSAADLVVGGGLGAAVLARPFSADCIDAAGADQVFLQGDAGVSQPGRDAVEQRRRCTAVLGLVLAGGGTRARRPSFSAWAIRFVEPGQLFAERWRGPSPPRRRPRRRRSCLAAELTASARWASARRR